MRTRQDAAVERWRDEVRRAIPAADHGLAEEVAQYIADRWLRAIESGMASDAADAVARADLDGWRGRPVPRRRARWRPAAAWLGWGADARFAVRALRVRPLFTAGAALLSAMAVTAVVAAFAIVYGILWRPLPYPQPERLAVVWQVRGAEQTQISYPDFADVSSAPVFDGAAAMGGGRGSLRLGDAIERVNALQIEAPALAMLGARPSLGRLLSAADAGQPVVMISHRLWTTHLQSDPRVIGRVIWLSGGNYTIVGVLQSDFDFELPIPPSFKLERNDVWSVLDRSSPFMMRRDVSTYAALLRLAPGRTLQEAQAAADATAARLAREQAATNSGRTFRIAPLRDEVIAPARKPLLLALLAAGVTLLVALANLVILGLVRGSERHGELSIRDALGAGPYRLRRQLFTEHLAIAACGCACGTAAAVAAVRALVANEAAHLPRVDAIRFDAPVLFIAAALALVIASVMTMLPLRLRSESLKSGARAVIASRRPRRVMVATEIALALVLASGGALLALSLARVLAVDPGFDPDGAAAARVSSYPARYPAKEHVIAFFDKVGERLRGSPAVIAVGASSSLPLSGQTSGTSVVVEGHPLRAGERPTAGWQFVTPGYFAAVGMRIVRGRDFTSEERSRAAHVTVINEDLARTLFGGEDPIGRRLGVGGGDQQGDWHEVVGVVADVRHQALDMAATPRIYDLFGQHWGRSLFIVVRSRMDPAVSSIALIRRTVGTLDPEAPVFEASTLRMLVDRSSAARRLASALALSLALAGVVLALIGMYAVAASSVADRTKEIGVRAALGATPRDLFALIAREGARTAAVGGAAGLAASVVAVRMLQAQLFGVRLLDALWLVPLVAAAVLGAAFVAALPPARRAAAADPLAAMRVE